MLYFIAFLRRVLNPQQICLLCLLATMSLGGYAMRTFANNSDVVDIKVELLQTRLLDLKIKQCEAIKAQKNTEFFAGQIQVQTEKYYILTGRLPSLPTCSEL
jgi:hypothetical protein